MSRRMRAFVLFALVSFAFTAAACAEVAAPQAPTVKACDTNGADVC